MISAENNGYVVLWEYLREGLYTEGLKKAFPLKVIPELK